MPTYVTNPLASPGDPRIQQANATLSDLFSTAQDRFNMELAARRTAADVTQSYAGAYANEQLGNYRVSQTASEDFKRAQLQAVRDEYSKGNFMTARAAALAAGLGDNLDEIIQGQIADTPGLGGLSDIDRLGYAAGLDFGKTPTGTAAGLQNNIDVAVGRQREANMGEIVTGIGPDGMPVQQPVGGVGYGGAAPLPPPILSETDARGLAVMNLDPRDQRANVLGTAKPQEVLIDGIPQVRSQQDAMDRGLRIPQSETNIKGQILGDSYRLNPTAAEAFVMRDTRAPRNWILPAQGGNPGSTEPTIDGLTNAMTGQPLTPGGYYGTITGGKTDVGVDVTEAQARARRFVDRMAISNKRMNELSGTGYRPTIAQFLLTVPKQSVTMDALFQSIAGVSLPPEQLSAARAYQQTAQVFLTTILRDDSGAAVPVTEYPLYYAQFIPMPWDDERVLALKAEARQVAIQSHAANLHSSGVDILQDSLARYGQIGDIPPDAARQLGIDPNLSLGAQTQTLSPGEIAGGGASMPTSVSGAGEAAQPAQAPGKRYRAVPNGQGGFTFEEVR